MDDLLLSIDITVAQKDSYCKTGIQSLLLISVGKNLSTLNCLTGGLRRFVNLRFSNIMD